MPQHIIILCIGFVMDLILGDPHFLWHPVQGIGKLIEWTEKGLFALLRIDEEKEADRRKKQVAGCILVIVVLFLSVGIAAGLLYLAGQIHPWLSFGLRCVFCYQMLAMKSLRVESMKVYRALTGDVRSDAQRLEDLQKETDAQRTENVQKEPNTQRLEDARKAVSMIVGRDTENLSEEGVIRAAVETVAENTSDGVIAPLFYMLIFGSLGGVCYKAVNTMDSMIGYKNDRYCYFGTAAAKLDDLLNLLPARISALAMILAAFLLRLDGKNAWRIFKRDRYHHKSPNSAQTEAVCAGALLAGDAFYFGKLVKKPTIGDPNRRIEPDDIRRANRLMYVTSILVLGIGVIIIRVVCNLR